jgi:hypothetical protein
MSQATESEKANSAHRLRDRGTHQSTVIRLARKRTRSVGQRADETFATFIWKIYLTLTVAVGGFLLVVLLMATDAFRLAG